MAPPLSLIERGPSDAQIARLYVDEGRSLHAIAHQFWMSREQIRSRLRAFGIALRAERQPPTGPRAVPYGWRREGSRLVLHEGEHKVITKIRRDRAEGRSLHAIARELAELGIKTKTGGQWHAKTISQIIAYASRVHAQ